MRRIVHFYILVFTGTLLFFQHPVIYAQSVLQSNNLTVNRAGLMLTSDSKLNVGGYAQVDFNQPFGKGNTGNGKLDVHRVVLLFGYRFTNRLSFVTEIEIEHVSEVYIEQAFFNYAFNTYFNLRGGLLLIPMGIINEYHEPPTFNGVERPIIDKYIAPTTWREIGIGATGNIPEISFRYQAYLVNGFKSYMDGKGYLDGSSGLRRGRQKGAESIILFPGISTRVEYYGVLGLNLGLSWYFGKTQSTMFNDIERHDNTAIASADSSVVGVSMIGADVRYNRKGFGARAQVYYTSISNARQYNYFTAIEGKPNDLGSSMYGYYFEVSYNVFQPIKNIKSELIPFIRFSQYDTQATVDDEIEKNKGYQTYAITVGMGYWFISQLALKTDVQFLKRGDDINYHPMFNAGIAVMF